MGQAIHSAIVEISRALQAQGVAPAGPWFAHHHRRPTDTFDFNVCFPIASAVALSGRLQTVAMPEQEVVRTAFHGDYDGLPTAWPEFVAWVAAQGYKVRDDFYEVYSIGPRETPEVSGWQTDLILPLQGGEAAKERVV